MVLSELETFMTLRVRDYRIGTDLSGVVSSSLLIYFQKLNISATRQQKAPRGFLCSFTAGGGKEIKGFGPVSLTVWCNFVVCTEAHLVFSMA